MSSPKSTFDKASLWQQLCAAWKRCKTPVDSDTESTFTSHLPRPAIRWLDEGKLALRAFDFGSDADAVCSFQQETYQLNFEDFQYTPDFARAFRHDLRRAARDGNNGLFVLQQPGETQVCGFMWLLLYQNHWTCERYGYVNNLYLTAPLRGRGLGHELMRHAEDYFRAHQVHLVRLSVTAANHAAAQLYESSGYQTLRWEMEKRL